MRPRWLMAAVAVALLAAAARLAWPSSAALAQQEAFSSMHVGRGAWYTVYFTRPHAQETAADRHGGLDEALIADLDRATHSVDVAVFDLDLESVGAALQRAAGRGVAVRLVVDAENLDKPRTAWVVGAVQRAGIAVTFDRRSAFMHDKFIVIDSQIVWTGSWNLTINDTYRNNNNMLRINSPALAANYSAKFAALFAGRGGPGNAVALPNPTLSVGATTLVNAFSPDAAITAAVAARIGAATTSLDILAFTWTSDELTAAVAAAVRRGVRVRGVLETRNANAGTSSFPDLQAAGADVQLDGNCYNLHDKVLILDGQTVITGSFNWTNAAQTSNDENVVMITDPTLAAHYTTEFERIAGQSRQPDRC